MALVPASLHFPDPPQEYSAKSLRLRASALAFPQQEINYVRMGFGGLDYAVLFLYLAATAAFGLRIGRDQGSLQAYFLGRRSLPWWAVCFSIVATETSTLTFIGAPAIAYDGNLTFLQVAFGYILGRILVTLILLPGYFRGHIVSAYEVLQRSLGTPVRNFSAFLFQEQSTPGRWCTPLCHRPRALGRHSDQRFLDSRPDRG